MQATTPAFHCSRPKKAKIRDLLSRLTQNRIENHLSLI